MLRALVTSPERALDILENTTPGCRIPGYKLIDVVSYLSRWQNQLSERQLATYSRRLVNAAMAIFDSSCDGRVRLRQHVIYNLTEQLDTEGVAALYRFLCEKGNPIAELTLLHFASRLARVQPYKELAMEIVTQAINDGIVNFLDSKWQAVFTTILFVDKGQASADNNFDPADAFVHLLERGLAPNLVTYTTLINSLAAIGQYHTAGRIYDILEEQNITPDNILFSAVLNLAKVSRSVSLAIRITQEAVRHDALDEVFLNDLLFSIFDSMDKEAREKKRAGEEAMSLPGFGPMLVYYARVFNLGPLQALIPLDLKQVLLMHPHPVMPGNWQAGNLFPALELATSSFSEKRDPTGATLSIMFLAYVKTLSQPVRLISLYSYLRQRVIQRDPIAVQHIEQKGSFMYDVILKALLEHPGMQRPALDIVSDMLKGATKPAPEPEPGADVSPEADEEAQAMRIHPPPSVYTWTILLGGLLFYGEKESAKRIQAMMKQHGIEPNQVTWNTLVTGYAGLQDVNGTVRALEGLEKAGYSADQYTMKGFRRLLNQEKALLKLEANMGVRSMNKKASQVFAVGVPLEASLEEWKGFAEERYRP
ncbi:pentatricopeptide repeat-containing protein [Colletotrichum sojae]|uniref:Pentatricopeptide repeat-containing protein n=1 Tax=Colletotrichum sojae TaxID=2175907 RepID=A0A8H6N4X9_9PEZI|nr:pentatricopeptide repeat-containing protein [Colletotrichum sojae]